MSAERLYSIPWNLPKMTAPAMVNGGGEERIRWCRSDEDDAAPAALPTGQERIQIPDEGALALRGSGKRARRLGVKETADTGGRDKKQERDEFMRTSLPVRLLHDGAVVHGQHLTTPCGQRTHLPFGGRTLLAGSGGHSFPSSWPTP